MRRALVLGALLFCACPPAQTGGSGGSGGSGGGTGLVPCVERPTDLPRPPDAKGLPCELLPPGFTP